MFWEWVTIAAFIGSVICFIVFISRPIAFIAQEIRNLIGK